MKNTVIVLLTVISIASVSFGLYQKSLKDQCEVRMIELNKKVEELTTIADEQRKLAEQNAAKAAENLEYARSQAKSAEEKVKKAQMAR